MNHKENYKNLQATLATISTKGNDTLVMADCQRFLNQCIEACEKVPVGHQDVKVEKATE